MEIRILDLSYFVKLNFAIESTFSAAFNGLVLDKFILPANATSIARQLIMSNRIKKANLILFPEGFVRSNTIFSNGGTIGTIVYPSTFNATFNYGGNYALFHYSSSGFTVICKAQTPPTLVSALCNSTTPENIYVPDESVNAYKGATFWSAQASKIKGLSEYPGVIPKYPIRTVID